MIVQAVLPALPFHLSSLPYPYPSSSLLSVTLPPLFSPLPFLLSSVPYPCSSLLSLTLPLLFSPLPFFFSSLLSLTLPPLFSPLPFLLITLPLLFSPLPLLLSSVPSAWAGERPRAANTRQSREDSAGEGQEGAGRAPRGESILKDLKRSYLLLKQS